MKNKLFLGAILTLVGMLFYSIQTAIIKVEMPILPPLPVVIFIQSVTALLFVFSLMFRNKKSILNILHTRQLGLQLMRTVFSLIISYTLFSAVQHIPLVNAMLLANTAPLMVPFLAYFFMSQPINHRLWLPMLIGFLGVAFVLHPDGHIFNPFSFLAIIAAVMMASSILAVRKLAKTDSSETITFYFFLFSAIFSGIAAIYFWVPMTLHMWIATISIGILYFFSQYALTQSLHYANAELVSALLYSNIIYSVIISFLFWGTFPTWLTIFGTLLVMLGGVLCIYEEYRKKVISDRGILTYVKQTEAA